MSQIIKLSPHQMVNHFNCGKEFSRKLLPSVFDWVQNLSTYFAKFCSHTLYNDGSGFLSHAFKILHLLGFPHVITKTEETLGLRIWKSTFSDLKIWRQHHFVSFYPKYIWCLRLKIWRTHILNLKIHNTILSAWRTIYDSSIKIGYTQYWTLVECSMNTHYSTMDIGCFGWWNKAKLTGWVFVTHWRNFFSWSLNSDSFTPISVST